MCNKNVVISAVIPARNEEDTIGDVITTLKRNSSIEEVIVVNNDSADNTAIIAQKYGATVVFCAKVGLGYAMKTGIEHAKNSLILKTDADIDNWNSNWLNALTKEDTIDLVRAIYTSPYNKHPMTNYVTRPFLKKFRPEIGDIPQPLAGTYIFNSKKFNLACLGDGWSFDISLLLFAHDNNLSIVDCDIGILSDKVRSFDHYIPMAEEISWFLCDYFGVSRSEPIKPKDK